MRRQMAQQAELAKARGETVEETETSQSDWSDDHDDDDDDEQGGREAKADDDRPMNREMSTSAVVNHAIAFNNARRPLPLQSRERCYKTFGRNIFSLTVASLWAEIWATRVSPKAS